MYIFQFFHQDQLICQGMQGFSKYGGFERLKGFVKVCWVCQSMHLKVLKKCFIFLHCIFILIIFVMMHLGQKQRISQGEILLPWLKGPYPNDTLYGSYFWCICLSIYSTLIMDAPIIIALTLLHDGFSMVDDDGTTQICLSPITITDNNHLFLDLLSLSDLFPICYFFCICMYKYRVFKLILATFQSSD